MKRNLLLSTLFALFALVCMGNPVDPATARQVASHFWTAVTGSADNGRWTDVAAQSNFQEFYLLTRNPEPGFVIVAADDCVQPILGYSIQGEVLATLPAHVAAFLQSYNSEIAYYKENGIAATEEITALWNSLTEGTYTPTSTTALPPLLTTIWDQGTYYNTLCPDSAGQHAPTGCTATATAQIMKYWNWPTTGVGSHDYWDNNFGYQSADFGATTYEWENMPNYLTNLSNATEVNAVATLMYHVGVAVEMNYGLNGSGAYVHNFGYVMPCSESALPTYFRYKNTLHSLFKAITSDDDWISAITADLDAGRPILETGFDDEGGHAFVIDGYDNNGLFHINWGWGGAFNGYYAHNALNPGGGGIGSNSGTYNLSQAILLGIEPDGLLTVSPLQVNLPQAGGSNTITMTPNVCSSLPWYAYSNQPWLTVTPNNGNGLGGSATVTVTATANTSGNIRTATVTVAQGSEQIDVQVTQMTDTCTMVELPWHDSFEEGMGCWTTLDVDGDGDNWFLANAAANSGSYAMASFSYNSYLGGFLHADNYLISPAITLPAEGNHEFVFHAHCGSSNNPDTLMVKLTTGDGTAASQFDTTLLPLTPINNTNYQQFSVNLSAYNGQTVKVAIVHKTYAGNYLVVDDISIVNASATCTVTTLSANSTMGTATGGGSYTTGQSITLKATAGSGYRFTGWNDGSDENPRQVTVLGDATYIASFANLGGSEHHYDNGTVNGLIGTETGGSMYWGIRFPAGELSEFTTYSGTRFWNYDSGDYQVRIYQGGTDAPGTLVAAQTYTLTGNDTWYDVMLSTPVTIDHTQPLWVILYNDDATYPAPVCQYAGNPDGSWLCEDGSTWNTLSDLGFDLTWMIRALLTGTSATPHYTLTVNSDNLDMGLISGGGTFTAGDSTSISANARSGYRFIGWNDGNTENPRTVNIVSDSTFTAQFANLGDAEKHYDNGTYAGSFGADSSLYWGVRFPAGSLSGHDLMSGIKMMDIQAGTYELAVYQGGDSIPGNLISSQTVTTTGSNDWSTVTLTTPVSLNHAQPVWIVLHNSGTNQPAVGSHYAGNPDGSWVSTDGNVWTSVCDGNLYYTWMLRAVLSNTEPVIFHTITAVPDDATLGNVNGGGTYPDGATVTLTATAVSHYHFTQWDDGSTSNPLTITVTSDTTYTAYFQIDMHQINVASEMPDMGTTTGSGSFPYGSEIQIEAIPYSGYEFQRWIGGSTDNPRTVTVTGNKNYYALFQPAVGIEDMTMPEVTIYSYGNHILVDGAAGQSVEIYSMDGKLIACERQSDAEHRVFTVTSSGTYLVRTGNGTVKRVTVVK